MDLRAAGAPLAPRIEGARVVVERPLAADADLARARAGFGKAACAEVADAARRAALGHLAWRGPEAVKDELGHALTILLLCADLSADRAGAQAAADRLRRLGDKPDAVPVEVWDRYPELDAMNVPLATLKIEVTGPAAASC